MTRKSERISKKTAVRARIAFAVTAVVLAAIGIAILMFGLGKAQAPIPGPSPQAKVGGPFELVDETGKTVTDKTYRGKWLLVYFGYTYCPDVCPTTLNTIGVALHDLGSEAEAIQPLLITVDPERDTPETLAGYTDAFDPRLIGLTGTPQQIANAARVYGVYYRKAGEGDEYSVDHTSLVYVMDPDGRFVTFFGHDADAETMTNKLKQLLAQKGTDR
jgi:protein SCO1/2